jgi:PAS domain S-box-containing protein
MMQKTHEKSRILVVDDEKIITMHLEELLTNMGYDVVATASNGAEAIQRAQNLIPDLILMDIIMPGEMSGIEAAKEIKEELEIPVIFLTAFADDKIIEKAKVSEPFSYIVKPFQGQELKAAIEIALYRKEMERKLKESEDKYRILVEGSRDGVGIIQDGIFNYVNPALFEMLGRPTDFNTTPFLNYFADDCKERAEYIYNNRIQGRTVPHINEFTFLGEGDTLVPIETSATVISYHGKSAILAFYRSITERKQMEHMLDYLVHEINGRNQIAISNIEKLKDKTKDTKKIGQMSLILSLLFDNANAMKRAYKLLKVAQGKREFVPVDPVEKINEAIMAVTHQFPEENIRIHTHIDGVMPHIQADGFIEDVFYILLENSVKQTDEKEVEIEVNIKPDKLKDPKQIEIKIEDHSLGFSDEEKENIFRQVDFLQENGLMNPGLSIAKTVIESYSGEIHVEDRVKDDHKSGCAYIITLPISNGVK